jgi:hypothetical protein
MKLSDRSTYLVTLPSENYVQGPIIAIAPKYLEETKVGFLVAGGTSLGHQIVFDEVQSSGDELILKDADRVGDDGKPIYWKFEYLTHDLLATLGDTVSEHAKVMQTLTDTYMVQIFYSDYIEDWWREKPSVG